MSRLRNLALVTALTALSAPSQAHMTKDCAVLLMQFAVHVSVEQWLIEKRAPRWQLDKQTDTIVKAEEEIYRYCVQSDAAPVDPNWPKRKEGVDR